MVVDPERAKNFTINPINRSHDWQIDCMANLKCLQCTLNLNFRNAIFRQSKVQISFSCQNHNFVETDLWWLVAEFFFDFSVGLFKVSVVSAVGWTKWSIHTSKLSSTCLSPCERKLIDKPMLHM